MSWFGKGRSDVPRTWVAALEQVLQAVDPTGQLADFVLTGRHAGALKTLKGGQWWVQHAGTRNGGAAKKAMATLYAGFGDVDAAVLRRWGRVLDAALGAQVWGWNSATTSGRRVRRYRPPGQSHPHCVPGSAPPALGWT